jgi:hypothetical protein
MRQTGRYCQKLAYFVWLDIYFTLICANGGMDDVAASVGFAGWAFAAMCVHALFSDFISSEVSY